MGRRVGFFEAWARAAARDARERERRLRQEERERVRREREVEQISRERARRAAERDKVAKQEYLESREKEARRLSETKPIELVDGGGLLYLLEQQGVTAKIIFTNGKP